MYLGRKKEVICGAIAERRLLSLRYDGYDRVVEPHTAGLTRAGNGALRAWQVSGGSVSGEVPHWKMMRLDKMDSVEMLDDTFDGPRDGYKRGDSHMEVIWAEL